MTKIFNNPKNFGVEALAGFVAANQNHVQGVHGGVVRADASPDNQVAVVVGGGSGHYPAFAGWVGHGLAHGAACGNVFASPSASQILSVARASDNGGGVVFAFGNYAGDVLHFNEAAVQLKTEGIDARIIRISDDIASNPPEQHTNRRGIAGDLAVVKISGAAAQAGLNLDQVEAVALRANDHTRTIGVAFSGCTLPGADHLQFTVDEGSMAIGLGIHGEPGISTVPIGTAESIAELLVEKVLAEEPAREAGYTGRVAVILNGLGSTKYEELFVVYNSVNRLLTKHGLTIIDPTVGEQVTSLDMAGLSLTLTFLDEELEQLWCASADAPAFSRGSVARSTQRRVVVEHQVYDNQNADASEGSRAVAQTVCKALEEMALVAEENESMLAELDSVAGDGDHGQGMSLGTRAAVWAAQRAWDQGAGAATTLIKAGAAWAEGAGGTSGALWGAALKAAGATFSDTTVPTGLDVITAVEKGGQTILDVGGAKLGDKTMVDAVLPFITTLRSEAGSGLESAWRSATLTATDAANKTAMIAARLGRAKTHGDASLGHPDPGAVSFALMMEAIAEVIFNSKSQKDEER